MARARWASRLGGAAWLLLFAGCAAPAPLLEPGREITAELGPGETHPFTIDVAPGDFLRVVAEQDGVDLVLRFTGLGEVDGAAFDREAPLGVPEEAVGLAGRAGRARLLVAGVEADGRPSLGSYRLRLVERRPATERDRAHVAAELDFCRAKGLEQKRPRDAEAVYAAAAAAFLALGEKQAAAEARLRLGRLARQRPDGGEAARLELGQVLELLSPGDRPWLAAAAHLELGGLERGAGRQSRAAEHFKQARDLWRGLGEAHAEGVAWNNLGLTLKRLGELEQARSAYLKAAELWRDLPRARRSRAVVLSNLGYLDVALGLAEEAVRDFEAASELFGEIGESERQAVAEHGLGLVWLERGDSAQARAHFEAGLRLRRPGSRGAAFSWLGLGRAEQAAGRWAEAERAYDRAWPELSQAEDEAQAALRNARGWLLLGRGELAAARGEFESALKLAARLGNGEEEAAQLAALAEIERRRGAFPAARDLLEQALERVERRRAGTASLKLRASFLAGNQGYYGELVDVLLELDTQQPGLGFAAEALSVAERGRARALLDALAEAGAGFAADAPPEQLERERQLARRFRQLGRLVESARWEGDDPASFENLRRDVGRELDDLRSQLRRERSPANRTLAEPLDARGITALLDAETEMLVFRLGPRRSVLWHLTPQSLDTHFLPVREVLDQAAREAHTLLGAGYDVSREPRLEGTLAALSRQLLGPVAGRLRASRLVIVPDGALAFLPFAALPDPTTGAPLLGRHEVVMLPSPSALGLQRGRPRRGGWRRAVTVVGDPVYEPGDPRLDGRAAARRGGRPLARLKFAAAETRAVAAAAGGSSRVLTGFEARRDRLMGGALAGSRALHFATHGRLDSQSGEDSGLELSRFDAAGEPIEGLLNLADVYHLRLDAELVTLSACQTALGKEVRGEGVVGLAQGFLEAGVLSLVASLWRVDDEATAELMARLYHHLFAGAAPAEALRTAQLEIAAEPRWRSPYYWAPFVFEGEWKSPRPRGR